MSICDNCIYGYAYKKPEPPEDGFPSDIIGKRTGLAKFFKGENIYRGEFGFWDSVKDNYEYRLNWHENKIWCEALPVGKQVDKHETCSMHTAKD